MLPIYHLLGEPETTIDMRGMLKPIITQPRLRPTDRIVVAWRCVEKLDFFGEKNTPWKFNSEFTPENLQNYHPKRKGSSSNYHFSGAMLNFKGVDFGLLLQRYPD